MKPPAGFFSSDWKLTASLSAVLFAALVGYGISQHFDDLALFAVAMAIASWHVCSLGLHTIRKWQEWRAQK
jgi:hypothetical protein